MNTNNLLSEDNFKQLFQQLKEDSQNEVLLVNLESILTAMMSSFNVNQVEVKNENHKYDYLSILVLAVMAVVGSYFHMIVSFVLVLVSGFALLWLRNKFVPSQTYQQVEINQAQLQNNLELLLKQISTMLNVEKEMKVEPKSQPSINKYETIHNNKQLSRWIQMFALLVMRKNQTSLTNLYEDLKQALECMGIYVFDELEEDEKGNVILPCEDYFIDGRKSEEWTKVTLPIVYTDKKVLMAGRIE